MVHYVQVEYFGDEGYESEGSWASASQVFKELDKNDRHLIKTEDAIFGDEDDSDDEDFLSEEEESEDESSESDDGSAGSCRDHNQQGDSTRLMIVMRVAHKMLIILLRMAMITTHVALLQLPPKSFRLIHLNLLSSLT